jgi:hypothetical protein
MALSPEDRERLEALSPEIVRQRLSYAGAGDGSIVPGLGRPKDLLRGDVEEWLAEKDKEAAKLQQKTLAWARAAAWISIVGIVVAVVLALIGK